MTNIDEVIRRHERSLFEIPGVTGVGQTVIGGEECILVMLEQRLPESESAISTSLDGYPVAIEVSGVIQILGEKDENE